MSKIICDVVAKDKVLYSGSLYSVMIPSSDGELGILANHEPLVSALKDGVIWARTKKEGGVILSAAIMGGYAQVLGERVIVLCDKARALNRINVDKLEKDIPELEARIARLPQDGFISRSVLTRKLRWCRVQLEAKKRESRFA